MLQFIVGWRRFDNEDWANTMKRMNARLSSAMSQYLIASRIQQLRNRKFTLASTFASQSGWHTHTIKCVPAGNWRHNFTQMPHRKQGRPATRWDDDLRNFADKYFGTRDWLDCATFSLKRRVTETLCVLIVYVPPDSSPCPYMTVVLMRRQTER